MYHGESMNKMWMNITIYSHWNTIYSCRVLDPVFSSGETSNVGFGAADQPVFSDGSRTPSIIPQVKTPIRTTTHHAGPGHMWEW